MSIIGVFFIFDRAGPNPPRQSLENWQFFFLGGGGGGEQLRAGTTANDNRRLSPGPTCELAATLPRLKKWTIAEVAEVAARFYKGRNKAATDFDRRLVAKVF